MLSTLSPIQAVIAGKGISFSPGESLLSKSCPLVIGIGHVQWSVIAVRILGQLESNRTGYADSIDRMENL